MSRVSRAGVLAAYRDGVMVICELAAHFSDANWLAATPCAEWRAVDLAGHLRRMALARLGPSQVAGQGLPPGQPRARPGRVARRHAAAMAGAGRLGRPRSLGLSADCIKPGSGVARGVRAVRFFAALAGRIRELYAQAGTAQEPGGAPE